MANPSGMIDPAVFEGLQAQVDEDRAFVDELKDIVKELEKINRANSFVQSRAHSTRVADLPSVLTASQNHVKASSDVIAKLAAVASTQPYYKFNQMWTRQVQDAIFGVLFWAWLGGKDYQATNEVKCGRLLTIEELGQTLGVKVNIKDKDEFHITTEEYLLSLISVVEELTRLARNAVTLGDYERPLLINQFVKDVFAGFQILNLKNDILRKRGDGLKYRVKDVEDVVYDLSLRNLLPKKAGE